MDMFFKKNPFQIILEWWKSIPKQVRVAFISAVIVGAATHIYGFIHLMPNHDGVDASIIFYKDMTYQGRWFQKYAMLLTSTYNMPWVNGCFSILYLATAVGFTVSVAGIQSKMSAILVAGLLVTFPTIASSFAYLYMTDGFMIALLLAALAVYISRKIEKSGFLIAAVLLCFSLGIYQAYICYAIALFVVLLIIDILQGKKTTKEICIRSIKDFLALVLGIALYVVVLFVLIRINNVQLTDYQGLNQISLSSITNIIPQTIVAFKSFFAFFLNIVPKLLNVPAIIMYWVVLIASAFFGIYIFFRKRIWRKPVKTIILAILVVLTPIALNSIYLLSAEWIHLLMIYSMAALFILFIRLAELYKKCTLWKGTINLTSWIIMIASVIIIFESFLLANKGYISLQAKFHQTYAYSIKVAARIEDSPYYHEDMPIALVGCSHSAPVMPAMPIGFDFDNRYIIFGAYNYYDFFRDYVGVEFYQVSDEVIDEIKNSEEFNEMPVYPAHGSISMYGDVLVIKLGDE